MSSVAVVASVAVLLVASVIICPSNGITGDILAAICSQTQNQETCEAILESDPRTGSADLPLLSLVSLELLSKQADKNHNSFVQFRENSTDLDLKRSFGNCVTGYNDMQGKIKVALRLSQKRQYKRINELGQLIKLAYGCENGLPSNSPTSGITETMLLTSQTAVYVNQFLITSFG
ncbi:hypothetical protein SADUNF_Sadunf13G0005000 [Salix dunnii]|uniref:Pectinesterase inhibitor domain-containing protein n=1 Tax=Salix dunnii TaxID=1413687 RepID=A0A835JEP6_9ROSI|nr:hypothetical protein SADUNF_Sadunf13G0005000 [Salix dunnii]